MAGYTRQSTFTDGDTITAALFNNEFDHLLAVFSNSTGHKHDGTASEGPVIGLIGDAGETTPNNKVLIDSANNHIEFYIEVSSNPVQQLYIADGAILPVTDNDIDLGSSSLEFKDLFIDGTANIDSLVADTADINGGTLDNVTIGATTAAAGTFTTVTTTSNVIVGGNLTVSGTTTTVNSNEVNIGDNIIVLNSDETGTPSQNGGIEIERGTSTNVSLVWNETNDYWTFGSNHLNFPDNSKAYFGTSNDLEIYHDGSNSYIKDGGTGNLRISGTQVDILNPDSNEFKARFKTDGAVELYHDNSKKFETASGGVTITGTATATAFSGPLTGNVTGDVTGNVAGNLTGSVLTAAQTNITSLGTLSSLAVSGDLTVDTNTLYVDSTNNRVGIGTSSPSKLLHLSSADPTIILTDTDTNADSRISANSSAGSLFFDADLNNESAFSTMSFRIDGSEKVRIDTSGNVGIGTSSPGARLQVNGSTTDTSALAFIARNSGGTSLFSIRNDGRVDIPAGNLNVTNDVSVSGNLIVTGNATINGNLTFGDANTDTVSFGADIDSNIIPDDDNTYDLGSSSQEWKDLYIDGVVYADQIDLGDNEKIRLGASQDLEIYHDGSDSIIHDNGTGNLKIRATNLRILNAAGTQNLISHNDGGDVKLYHAGNQKLATTSTGIDVTGGISASSTVNAFGNGSVALQWGDTTALGALSFDGSANPLIRSYSSKPLVFQTNGANERMRIDSSGRLLINTTTSIDNNSQIHIKGFSSGVARITMQDVDGTGQKTFFSQTNGTTTVSTQNNTNYGDFAVQGWNGTNSAEFLRVDGSTGGNVGIGTTSPSEKLHVQNSSSGYSGSYNARTQAIIESNNSTGTVLSIMAPNTGYSGIFFGDQDGEAVGQIQYDHTPNALRFATSGTEQVRINSVGNLGIGTSSPASSLHVHSTNFTAATFERNNALTNYGVSIDLKNSEDNIFNLACEGTEDFSIGYTPSGGSKTNLFTLNSSGNLGIGTTSPARLLDVNGTARLSDGASLEWGGTSANIAGSSSSNTLFFNTASTERARIDSGGKLLVGKTTGDTTNTVGHELKANGIAVHTTDGTGTLFLNRKTSNGTIIELRKDNSAVGVIGTQNWGIGTSSPSEQLHINGSTPKIQIQDSDGTNQFSTLAQDGGSYILTARNNTSNGNIIFKGNNGTSVSEYARFNSSGNFSTQGDVTVGGNLTVSGTTTTLNTATLDVEDKNITLNKGSGDTSASADGAGITIQDAVDASNDATILWNASADRFDFSHGLRIAADDQTFTVGAGGDFALSHNGTDTFMANNTGHFYITTTSDDKDIIFRTDDGSGGVTSYLTIDGSHSRMTIAKDTLLFDNVELRIGDNSGAGDLKIYHNGTHSILENSTGDLILMNNADDKDIIFQSDNGSGGVQTYFFLDGSAEQVVFEKSARFTDNDKAIFGTGGDLEIYHDGNHSYIQDSGTGRLRFQASTQIDFLNGAGTETLANFIENDAVKLYFDNAEKLATTSTGISVTGGISSGALSVTSDTSSFIRNSTDNDLKFTFTTNNSSDFAQFVMDGKDGGGEKFLIAYGSTHSSTPNMLALKSNDSSAGSIGFFTNSAERARFDVNGRLGIGTTSPSQKLDVAGIIQSTSTNPQIRINTSSGTGAGYLVFGDSGDDDRGWISYLHASDALQFRVNASERLRIDSSGNVGIGTSSPARQLHVQMPNLSAGTGNGIRITDDSALMEIGIRKDGSGNRRLAIFEDGGTYPLVLQEDGGNVGIGTTSPSYALDVVGKIKSSDRVLSNVYQSTSTYGMAWKNSGGSDNMFLSNAGSLGIGTTSPTQALHVVGNGLFTGGLTVGSGAGAIKINESFITARSSDNANDINLIANINVFDADDVVIGSTSGQRFNDNIVFRTNGSQALRLDSSQNATFAGNIEGSLIKATDQFQSISGSRTLVMNANFSGLGAIGMSSNDHLTFVTNNTERMRLDNSGRLGLGTTSPAVKLDVVGDTRIKASSDSATALTLKRNSSSGRSQMAFTDESDNQIFRIGMTGAGSENFSFFDGSDTILELNRSSNTATFGGVINGVGGNASAPSYIFEGNTDTGFFHPATDVIGFSTGGSERMRIDSSGSLAVGNTSPSSFWGQANKLVIDASGNTGMTIKSTSSGNGRIVFTDTTSSTAGLNDGGQIHYGHSADDMRFRTAGADRVTINATGLGIGTTSPSKKLHVVGDVLVGTGISYNASADDILTIGATNRTAVNNGTYFNYQYKVSGAATGQDLTLQAARNIDGSSEDVESIFQYDASADAQIFFTNGTERLRIDSSGTLTTPSGTDMSILSASGMTFGSTTSVVDFKTNNTQAMRIDTSQRVGIGTTSPATDFHVTDGGTPPTLSGTYLIAATSSSNAGIAINSGNSSASIIALGDTDSQDIGTIRYNHSDNSMRFKVNGNSDVFVINSSGEVNINQSNLVIEHASSPFIQLKDTTQNASFKVYAQNSDVHVTTSSNHPMIFDINNSEKMRLDTSGRLGIGTTSPAEKLHIDGSIRFTGSLKLDGFNTFEKQSNTIFVGDRDDNDLVLDLSGFSESTAIEMNDGFMRFKSQGVEKIRMDSSGNLLVGTTTQNLSSSSFGTCLFPTGRAIHSRNVDGGASVMQIFGSAGECRILGDGDIQNTNNSYGGISDVRLKENIVDTDKKLDILNKVRIVDFNFIQKADTQTGVIAQELEEILPDLVSTGEDSYKTVKYSKFVPMLIKAIQEQQEEIEQLKKHSHSPKGLENMEGYESLVETIETLKAEIKLLQGGN